MMETDSILSEHVRQHEDELLELVISLVSAQSVTGQEQPAQSIVIEYLEELNLEPDVWEPDPDDLRDQEGYFETSSFVDYGYEGRSNVATRLEGDDGRTLTVGGHIDVVDVTETEWERDPWQVTREDDVLYGRGVADMKGGLAATLIAIRAIQEAEIELKGDLIFQSTIEEEDGGVGGALSALERGYVPDATVIAEPFDIPNICVASAGVMYFRVIVPGESVHAAWGHEGTNAIGNATAVYTALEELDEQRKAQIDYPPAYRADPALEGNVTNVNVGTIDAGDWPSTVPSEAVLEGRVGWPPGESRSEVRNQIETAVESFCEDDSWLAANPPKVEWFGWQAAPHETDPQSEIAQTARRTAESITGKKGQFVGGNAGLDERFYKRYYDIDSVSVGPKGVNLHGADEHTTLPSLLDTADTLAHIIVDYLGTESL